MIKVSQLSKRFGKLDVLQDLNLKIDTGRITALIGHNGSGKTTLIKCILGLDTPSSGAITYQDKLLSGEVNYRRDIGYMPQIARFPENLCAREVFSMISDLRSNPGDSREELIEYFGLQQDLEKPLRVLSGGNRQKVSVIIAFMFDPQFLILDEPTAGLDPRSSGLFKDRIRQLREQGRTILITSHLMSELEELADEIVFLLDGHIVFQGPLAQLISETNEENLERAVARLMD